MKLGKEDLKETIYVSTYTFISIYIIITLLAHTSLPRNTFQRHFLYDPPDT